MIRIKLKELVTIATKNQGLFVSSEHVGLHILCLLQGIYVKT